jgi:eukaryotic-like serine/threonine-protein kinase
LTSGRTREAVPLMATASSANPGETVLSLKVAALQAWFGEDKELAATRQRILTFALGTNDVQRAERAAKACSIRPSADTAELEAALVLGRRAVDLGKTHAYLPYYQLALGMAEYRAGKFAAADQALRAAAETGKDNPQTTINAAFYRAMSLFKQGNHDEARKLAAATAAKMRPLPADEKNPLASATGNPHDDLILWMAYKEAKRLIGFDIPPASAAKR